jgi:hypothetical protein
MSQLIDLGKLRFHFAGDWSSATTYESNDIVKYGGNVYVYTNPVRTSANLPTDIAYWALMVEGFKFQGVFNPATQYRVGDGIAYGGKIYIAIKDSQAQVPPSNLYWSQFVDGIQWEGAYNNTRSYQKNDVVTYGPQAYIALQDSTGNLPTNIAYWTTFVSGISAQGVYNSGTTYVPGDIVAYGANLYRNKLAGIGVIPTTTANWDVFAKGNDFQGVWAIGSNYLVGQTVRFGGNVYQALTNNTGQVPSTATSDWLLYYTGINTRNNWITSTYYAVNDVVNYGGNSYICKVSHTSNNFNTDLTAATPKWEKYNSGVRYMGSWTTGTQYLKDDIISFSVSTYICKADHVAGVDFFLDLATNTKWQTFVVGAAYVLPETANNAGKYLQTPDGQNYSWQFAGANDKIYYVCNNATSSADDTSHGQSIDYAFASIRYACSYIAADMANRSPATIFVKDGIYSELLPIIVPENVTIVGDGQRNCIIQPRAGLASDGVTPNNETTMFYLSSGVMIEGVLLKGLTGFVKSTSNPQDITTATVKGVYIRLNPASVITKSPYVKESSAFSTGGVGVIVDGSVGPAGSGGSMVFHTFTQVHDGGVGFWVKDRGLSEIVSCFTYYCDFGLVSSGGGKIRGLNCNNSYGTYGSVSSGFDTSETALTGTMFGDTLEYDPTTLTGGAPSMLVGDTISPTVANSSLTVSSVSIASQSVVTTTIPHGLYDGQPVSFSNVSEAVWKPLLGDSTDGTTLKTWYADVTSPTTFKLCSNFDATNYFDTRAIAGWGFVRLNFTDVLRSNPVIVQIPSHGFTSGEKITEIAGVGGMTPLNGQDYWVTVLDPNRISLYTNSARTTGLDGTVMNPYTGGGAGTRTLTGTTLSSATLTKPQPKATVTNLQTSLGNTGRHRIVISNLRLGNTGQTYKVNTGMVGLTKTMYLNGTSAKKLDFTAYTTRQYVFEQNDATNAGESLYFTTTDGGTTEYTTGVSYWINNLEVANKAAYISGFAAATSREVRIQVATNLAGSTIYYRATTANMGGAIKVVAHNAALLDRFAGETLYPFIDGSSITNGTTTANLISTNAHKGQYGFSLVLGNLTASPIPGGSIEFTTGPVYSPTDNPDITEAPNTGEDSRSYIITTVSGWDPVNGTVTVTLSQEKLDTADSFYGQHFNIRYNYSQVRLTGHDFLSIGTGGRTTTNYPGVPTQAPSQGNEVIEALPGRVYYVSTDQDGNFRIGKYFRVDQATGRATLDASAFDLSGLTSLRLGSIGAQIGEQINEFSSDGTMSGNSNLAVPTEYAVKTYVDALRTYTVAQNALKLNKAGDTMTGALTLSGNPSSALHAAPKQYIDATQFTYSSQTAAFTAANKFIYLVVPDAAMSITLPTSPTTGTIFGIADVSGTFKTKNVTVLGGGQSVLGAVNDLVLDLNYVSLYLYYDSTLGWRII